MPPKKKQIIKPWTKQHVDKFNMLYNWYIKTHDDKATKETFIDENKRKLMTLIDKSHRAMGTKEGMYFMISRCLFNKNNNDKYVKLYVQAGFDLNQAKDTIEGKNELDDKEKVNHRSIEYLENCLELHKPKMNDNINISNSAIDYDYMFEIQSKIREVLEDNFKQIKNTQTHNFTMFLMMITDLTNINNFYELYDLYKIDNWDKQNIKVIYDEADYEDIMNTRSKCCCGHIICVRSSYIITNGNTNSQTVVGKNCIRKCLTEEDWNKFKKMEPYKKYLKVSNKITKLKKKNRR